MRFFRFSLFILILIVAVFSILNYPTQKEKHFRGIAMTMPYHITIGHSLSDQESQIVQQTIHSVFEQTNSIYNKFNPASEISKINQSRSTDFIKISKPLRSLLLLSKNCWERSEGRFDPTVETEFPASFHLITLNEEGFKKELPELALDLGGIAKGRAVDELVEALRHLGYNNLLVEWSGEFKARGNHFSGRPWRVILKNPFDPHSFAEEIELIDTALATSGDYEQQWSDESGDFFFHICDPKTKLPMQITKNSFAQISVLAKECAEADALATAAMLFNDQDALLNWIQQEQKKREYLEFFIINH